MSDGYFLEVAKSAMGRLTSQVLFSPKDAEIIQAFKTQLLELTPTIVQEFYDGLFANPKTSAVFREGERPAREKTLADWWRRTVEGPVDDAYWAWQAYVGLIHVKRAVTNEMMLGQIFLIHHLVASRFPDQPALVAAVGRLLASVAAVIARGYDVFFMKSVEKLTGIGESLLLRQVSMGVDEVLAEYKRNG